MRGGGARRCGAERLWLARGVLALRTRLRRAGSAPALLTLSGAVAAQLGTLWSPRMLALLYSDALAVPLGVRPLDGALADIDIDHAGRRVALAVRHLVVERCGTR